MAKAIHTKTTATKMAACASLGLHYWADHPATGCVWAVDDNQQAHVVRWCKKTNTAALQTVVEQQVTFSAWAYPRGGDRVIKRGDEYIRLTAHDIDDRASFEVSESTQDLFKVAA